jgi:[acyl-carrier-protein] S-malonyltransferase
LIAFIFASEGVTTYVEVGPGTVLAGIVRRIHRDATIMSFGEPSDFASVETLLRHWVTRDDH